MMGFFPNYITQMLNKDPSITDAAILQTLLAKSN